MEGPQTRALADHLNESITGKPVEQILVPEHRWQANMLLLNCVGQVIQRVRSHGKWLFLDFSHGITWCIQLIRKSKCIVHSSTPRQEDDKPKSKRPIITLHLRPNTSDTQLTILFTGRPIFYFLPTNKVYAQPEIRAMGPDPLSTPTFHDDFPYRLRQNPHRTLAAALLDQETVAGLGNVLKCEILFAARFHPSIRVASLLASQIDFLSGTIVGIVATATTFATKNLAFPRRVYDRASLPCTICGADILVDRSGQDAHLSWYCPQCQPVGAEPTLFDNQTK